MDLNLKTSLIRFNAGEDDRLTSVTLAGPDGAEYEHQTAAVFVFIGLDPNTGWLDGLLDLDDRGFIATDRTMATSIPGVFAAGDVRSGSTKQLASAVGEGAAVSLQLRYYLEHRVR
jgi:thioredoxin reductase (NADPH)